MTEEHLVKTAGGGVQFPPAGYQNQTFRVRKLLLKKEGCWYNESSLCFVYRVAMAQVTTVCIHLW